MSTTHDSGLRSNRNPILRAFRKDKWRGASYASDWAGQITAEKAPMPWWILGATVSEQVFAARVLYRYAAVFGGAA